MLPIQNTGLIPEITPSAWLGGNIPYQVVNENANWVPFDVEHEKQKDPLETMACVTFSLLNNLEIQHKFRGVDINLADRFTAKVSNTQQNGNTFERVADSCRLSSSRGVGVVLEPIWPNKPKAQTWAEYYATIPQDVLQKALKVDFNYEIVPRSTNWVETLRYNLKQCPLWITWPANPYHAMTLLNIREDNINADVKDHYSNSIRRIKVSDIALAARVVLNQLINEEMKLVKDNGTVYLQVTPDIKFGIADGETLALFGNSPITEGNTTGVETYTISKGFILNAK